MDVLSAYRNEAENKRIRPRMVKQLMRPLGRRISAVHLVFSEYESIESLSLLGSAAALVIHCLFPDWVPLGVEYRELGS